MVFLNVDISEDSLKKAKAKAALLGLKLSDYIDRIIEANTENVSLEFDKSDKELKK